MSLFNNFRKAQEKPVTPEPQVAEPVENKDYATLARLALNSIRDGFLIVDSQGIIKMINPAAVSMTGCQDESFALGFDVGVCIQLEKAGGGILDEKENQLLHAIRTNQPLRTKDYVLVSRDGGKKTPIMLTVIPLKDPGANKAITLRDIGTEKKEEDARSEFISTASHEMRTPVASIEGYLGLALNPQTATIDARARGYLEAAQKSSQHLGRLFRDLLDVTKLDDKKIQPRSVPLELTAFVKQVAAEYAPKFQEKKLTYVFGGRKVNRQMKTLQQPVYTFADVDFLREIISNLIENAIKYTPEGGEVWVNVQGDENRALLSVEDSGIGISSEDLQHIFQKFYRANTSQTQEVGGTGLGLYIVKQRTEAMGGNVWAESVYGKGSVFGIALPRLSPEEFEKRKIALINEVQAQKMKQEKMLREATMAATRQATGQPAGSTVPVSEGANAPLGSSPLGGSASGSTLGGSAQQSPSPQNNQSIV